MITVCTDINSALVLKRGSEHKKLEALADSSTISLFSAREKAALAYAEAITCSDRQATSEYFEALRAYFNDDAIIELTALISLQNMSSKFNVALGVELQGFCTAAAHTSPPPDEQAKAMVSGLQTRH